MEGAGVVLRMSWQEEGMMKVVVVVVVAMVRRRVRLDCYSRSEWWNGSPICRIERMEFQSS